MNTAVRRSTRRQPLGKTLALAALLLAPQAPAVAATIYVNAAATGANNGSSWSSAFADLQSALAAAQSGDEIWVAAGTYKPTGGTDRSVSFVMKTGVSMYGGFAGTETERGQRDWAAHETVLSGDIGATGVTSDNSAFVVKGIKDSNSSPVDGFTISDSNANGGVGGGMYLGVAINCKFSKNVSNDYGGGLNGGDAINCRFDLNSARYAGGGMHYGSAVNCTFISNTAGSGGGLAWGSAENCTFTGNKAGYGGGMNNSTAVNCAFTANTARFGGAVYNDSSAYFIPKFIGCTFRDNVSDHVGGGIYNDAASAVIDGCKFIGNSASYGGAVANSDVNHVNGTAGRASPRVINCAFAGNFADGGGGMFNASGVEPVVVNCTFEGNKAALGGGIYTDDATPYLANCIFTGNSAMNGGGLYNKFTSLTAANCTFTSNTADIGGGASTSGIYYTILINCILWNDYSASGAEVAGGAAVFQSCDVEGCGGSLVNWNALFGADGLGNRDVDPRFVDASIPAGPDGIWMTADDGLRLLADSSCIDAGRDAGAPDDDILGFRRWGRKDLGAYETFFLNAAADWTLYR